MVRYFRKVGHFVFESNTDLLSSDALRAEIDREKWDVCIHLAARSAYSDCQKNPGQAYGVNLGGTAHIVELFRQQRQDVHFILTSSAQVYKLSPTDSRITLSEDAQVGPQTVYGRSKLLAEEVIRSTFKVEGGRFSILRLFNHTHKTQSREFFMPHIYHSVLESKSVPVRIAVGNIDVSRDIGSIFDLVRAFGSLADWGASHSSQFCETFNVCSGSSRNLREIALEVGRRLDKRIEFELEEQRVRISEIGSITGDNRRMAMIVGWQPRANSDREFVDDFLMD